MKNIPISFNEIIINKTLASQQNFTNATSNTQFASLLNNEAEEIKEIAEIEETTQIPTEQPKEMTIPQLELENLNYLNKIFLSFIV